MTVTNLSATASPDHRQGTTAIINGRAYRWPSNYQWKQLDKRHNADELDAIHRTLKDWFDTSPVTIELAQEIADNALSAFDASGQALAFLRRANGH
ncbi:hypothetical protein [Cohaesibacter intestini]|uniref:hypothetical protein n=1 Tax=Cohaesibacter intestini TaxID=2211145 RepID=UPI000DEA1CBA|nr:hypothetical protein [Cohaesibacter intestini]